MLKTIIMTAAALTICSTALAEGKVGKPAAAVLAKHKAIMGDECEAELEEQSSTYQLNGKKSLVIIPCYMGAYQGSSRVYIVSGNTPDATYVEQVSVLAYDDSSKGVVGTLDLTSADYDEKTKTLYTFAKGRGIGDCGQSSQSKVIADEYTVTVKTVEITSKGDCDGNFDAEWPVVFKQ